MSRNSGERAPDFRSHPPVKSCQITAPGFCAVITLTGLAPHWPPHNSQSSNTRRPRAYVTCDHFINEPRYTGIILVEENHHPEVGRKGRVTFRGPFKSRGGLKRLRNMSRPQVDQWSYNARVGRVDLHPRRFPSDPFFKPGLPLCRKGSRWLILQS